MKFLDSMVSRVRARFYKLSGIFREVLFLILLFLPVQFALMSRQPRTDVMTFTSLDLSSRSLPGRPRRSANVCDVSCQALCRHCPFIPVFKDTWGQNKCQSRLTVFFLPLVYAEVAYEAGSMGAPQEQLRDPAASVWALFGAARHLAATRDGTRLCQK